jgi:hypothetical protein
MHTRTKLILTIGLICVTLRAGQSVQAATVGFFGRGPAPMVDLSAVDPAIPTPLEVLGFALGEKPARHAQVIEYFYRLAEASPRVAVFPMGETYEGRELIYAVISTPERMADLPALKSNLAKIGDPRSVSQAEADGLIESMPASVWLAYSIHGDEISGVDASLGVAYRLAAGTDSVTLNLLDNLVVLIDPIENPDGRERYLAQMEAFASAVPFADGQSLQKGGFWPWGRGNHYFFDMNRDWFAQELPESKARIETIVGWQPQVLVDAHEMGQWDTHLFSPPRAPFNLQLTDAIITWWNTFAADQAKAFDQFGWSYYTREWNEEWYPGYGSSWPLYNGAIGILYEQAGVSGSRVSQHDGTVLTYSETVAHQYVSSVANLRTSAKQRATLLRHYHEHRRLAIDTYGGGPARAFLVRPDANPDRMAHLALSLERQQIEVYVASEAFSTQASSYLSVTPRAVDCPKGTLVIPTNQPTGFLIQTILGFDWHIPDSFLTIERRELLKHRDSKLYEVTSWSMLQAYGVDAYQTPGAVKAQLERWQAPLVAGGVRGENPKVGFALDMSTDRALRALAMLYERNLVVEAALKDLDAGGYNLPRGAIVLPRRANPQNLAAILDTVAGVAGVEFLAVESGRGGKGPDLGGGEVELLRKPRVAVVAAGNTNATSVGAVWHQLDQLLGLPASLLDVSRLGRLDLSIYNVIILPDAWGSYNGIIGSGAVSNLKGWVEDGGTLIALDAAAAFCADTSVGLSSVRVRRQVLDGLSLYQEAADLEIGAESPDISGLGIWEYKDPGPVADDGKTGGKKSLEELQKEDEFARIFSPHGAILRVDLDTEHWLTAGMSDQVPVLYYSTYAFLAKFPDARTVGRFAAAPDVRLSGLLWPEARGRLAHSSYCTREGSGNGQVILFAGQPNFRAYFRGSGRLLANAVMYGPGLGTSWLPDW